MLTDLPVMGMTCQACVARVRRRLGEVEGVTGVQVSLRRERARVSSERPLSRSALEAAVGAAGYEVGPSRRTWLSRDGRVWRDAGIAVLAVGALALWASRAGATEAITTAGGALASGGLVMVVVLGVAAGFSTCMAMVGGLVLAISARRAQEIERTGGELTRRRRLEPHLAFNAGRVLGFALGGALLGALGQLVSLSGTWLAVMMIAVSVVMGLLGLRLTEVSPRLGTLGLSLPAGLAAVVRRPAVTASGSGGAAVAGAATFLLPCGFTQAVQVVALATGDPAGAALVMALFALGTAPGLLAVAGLTSLVQGPTAVTVFRFAGVAVLALAAVNVAGATRLLGTGLVPGAGAQVAVSSNVTVTPQGQTLATTQGMTGYEPVSATVLVDRPVRWEMTSIAWSCASVLHAPVAGITTPLSLETGMNVIEFTPTETGTYTYTCGMGMFAASLTVIDDPEA